MIIYACLMRILDGMPLSVTNTFHKEAENKVQEGKRVAKLIIKYIKNLPTKLCVEGDDLTAHCVNDQSTCYVIVCDPSYPHILAYSFLDELMKEFSLLYTPSVVNAVKRPFGFIEFDSFLQKVQQKYNSPRSLTSRLNLIDMTNDLNMNPPVYKKLQELEPHPKINGHVKQSYSSVHLSNNLPLNGVIANENKSTVSGNIEGIAFQLKPISWYGRLAIFLSIPCIFLSGYRGVASLYSTYEEDEGPSLLHGLSFVAEVIILLLQIYCLRNYSSRRRLITVCCCAFIIVSNVILFDVREAFVVILYLLSTMGIVLATFRRNLCQGLPKFSV